MRHLVTFRSKPTHKTDIQALAVGQKQKINKWRLRLYLSKKWFLCPILTQKFILIELESRSLSLKARCQQDHFPSKGSRRGSYFFSLGSSWHSLAGRSLHLHGTLLSVSSSLLGWLVLAGHWDQLYPGSHFKCLYWHTAQFSHLKWITGWLL